MRRCRNCGTEIANSGYGWQHVVDPDIYGVGTLIMCDNVRSNVHLKYNTPLLTSDQAEPLTESENIIEILNNYCE